MGRYVPSEDEHYQNCRMRDRLRNLPLSQDMLPFDHIYAKRQGPRIRKLYCSSRKCQWKHGTRRLVWTAEAKVRFPPVCPKCGMDEFLEWDVSTGTDTLEERELNSDKRERAKELARIEAAKRLEAEKKRAASEKKTHAGREARGTCSGTPA